MTVRRTWQAILETERGSRPLAPPPDLAILGLQALLGKNARLTQNLVRVHLAGQPMPLLNQQTGTRQTKYVACAHVTPKTCHISRDANVAAKRFRGDEISHARICGQIQPASAKCGLCGLCYLVSCCPLPGATHRCCGRGHRHLHVWDGTSVTWSPWVNK